MVYATAFDEGLVSPAGDLGAPALCPDDCLETGICGVCTEDTCPVHGVPDPRLGEGTPDDTHLSGMCLGDVHRACHTAACRDIDCWV